MSLPDDLAATFKAAAWNFTALCETVTEKHDLAAVKDDDLGNALVAAVRLFAVKAQTGETPKLTHGNHVLSATDGAIFATAVLEAVGIEVFELAAWQACSNVGSSRSGKQHPGDTQ